ncbi:hypothetical protein PsorP6_005019 [Peronosclerospora sorghi]|uniref:Uncharacterized protein n=1 Tax=Peronosclerospora sorghi TaxID=230839 RepID=A0ACC0W6P0_9STRA|nr:hypothetical protein PsorP6_005019 [Peronosclerospora sorghi]
MYREREDPSLGSSRSARTYRGDDRCGLVSPGTALAAERGDLCVPAWLCRVYYPQGRITVAVEKSSQAGHVDVLEWLYAHHGNVFWGANEMHVAAE